MDHYRLIHKIKFWINLKRNNNFRPRMCYKWIKKIYCNWNYFNFNFYFKYINIKWHELKFRVFRLFKVIIFDKIKWLIKSEKEDGLNNISYRQLREYYEFVFFNDENIINRSYFHLYLDFCWVDWKIKRGLELAWLRR